MSTPKGWLNDWEDETEERRPAEPPPETCGREPYTQGETCRKCDGKPGENCPLGRVPYMKAAP